MAGRGVSAATRTSVLLVRIVTEHRRGAMILFPGAVISLPDDEAMVLVQDGRAVPAAREPLAAEARATTAQGDA